MFCQRSCLNWMMMAIILCALGLRPCLAGLNRWTSHGPGGGDITALSVDPHNPAVVFAGTTGQGIYKSNDYGSHWTLLAPSTIGLVVTSFIIDPSNSAHLLTGTWGQGLWESTDGGQVWTTVNLGSEIVIITALAIHPVNPNFILVSDAGGQIFRSIDGGQRWEICDIEAVWLGISTIAFNPADPSVIYAASIYSVYWSNDGGQRWEKVSGGFESHLINTLTAMSSGSSTTLLAGTSGGGIFQSQDGGKTWMASDMIDQDIRCILVLPSRALAGASDGVYRSIDGGMHWEKIPTSPISGSVTTLAASWSEPDTVYATTQGIWRSYDGGMNWAYLGLASSNITSITVSPTNSQTLLATTRGELYRSQDGGNSWSCINTKFLNDYLYPTICFGAGASVDLFANFDSHGMFKSTNYGETWVSADPHSQLSTINAIIPHPILSDEIFAISWDGKLFQTVNGGETWDIISTELPVSTRFLAIQPQSPATMYASADGLYKSEDEGKHWRQLVSVFSGCIRFDPADPSTLYIGGQQGVFRSRDGGQSWSELTAGLGFLNVQDLQVDPLRPNVLYIATNNGVFRSQDSGNSWEQINSGIKEHSWVMCLSVDPHAPNHLWAGTGGYVNLVFEIDISEGDLNDDHQVNHTDQNLLTAFLSGNTLNLFLGTDAADLNIDGIVDANDLVRLLKTIGK